MTPTDTPHTGQHPTKYGKCWPSKFSLVASSHVSPRNPIPLFLQVSDPSKYGVVVMYEQMKVERFVEKPQVGFLSC